MLSRRFVGFTSVLLLFLLVSARTPRAAEADKAGDSADPATKAQRLNRYAMQLFDDLNYALAEKTLLRALAGVEKANLVDGPAGLATHGNLAVLYSQGLRNPEKAVFHFKKALAIKPELKLGKQRSTPETEANLARARSEMAGGAAPQGKEAEPVIQAAHGDSTGTNGLKCPSGGEIQAGDEITLKCTTAGALRPSTVMVYYKANGGDQYQVLQMSKASVAGDTTTWAAKIPGSDTKAAWVPLYFEARDDSGATLALSGRDDSPSVIAVKGAQKTAAAEPVAASVESGDEGEEEGDENEEEGDEVDDSNPLARLEKERWREHQGSKGTWWLSLGVGSGFGYAGGHSTEAFGKYGIGFNPGLAFAGLGQAVPEVGYFFGRNTAVALTGRLQAILPRGPAGTATGALTGLLRLLFFTEDNGKVRWYFACAAGAGDGFRFQVEAQVLNSSGNPTGTVKDTVRGGPYVVGVGDGLIFKLGRHWRWTVDEQALVGFGNVSVVFDLTTGARYQF
jgi:hypothetical protein